MPKTLKPKPPKPQTQTPKTLKPQTLNLTRVTGAGQPRVCQRAPVSHRLGQRKGTPQFSGLYNYGLGFRVHLGKLQKPLELLKTP